MNLIFSLVVLVFLSYSQLILSLGHTVLDMANPMNSPGKCGRPGVPRSQICDPDDMMTKEDKDIAEGLINAIKKAEIAVAVVSSMSAAFIGLDSIETASERFAIQLHNKWGIGDSHTQNGVLIFLSVGDRSVFISRGDGMRSLLTTSIIDTLIDNMRPSLKAKEYGRGIQQCITEVDLVISGRQGEIKNALSYTESISSYIFFAIIIYLICAGINGSSQESTISKLRKGDEQIKKLMKEITEINSGDVYASKSCPVCLEDFSDTEGDEDSSNTRNATTESLNISNVESPAESV